MEMTLSTIAVPSPCGPVPSARQMTWQKHELLMFCHFGIKTYYVNDNHMGTGEEDPGRFNPAGLDTRQWLKAAKAGGFKGIVLTTKHHDGFCNWQTATTDFSVKSSPWKNGNGDVVRELADACHEEGMWFGLYLSVYDRNYSVSGKDKDAYCEYYAQQLTELCTNYGEIDELWFDGFGSQNMKVDWERLLPIIKEHQPKALIFGGGVPTLRWPGNERGDAGEPNWSVQPAPDENLVVEEDARWFPAEADTTAQGFWFWNRKPICSLERLQEVYATSVGRGGVALINVPPNQDGLIDDASIDRLAAFKAWMDGIGARTVAPGELTATASSVRGNDPRFGPEQALNGSYDSYWTTDDDVTTGHLEVDLGRSMDIDGVLVQEYIPLGQRVAAHRVEFWDGARWCEVAAGTTIGYKRLHWEAFKARRVRLLITQSRACPLINAFRIIAK